MYEVMCGDYDGFSATQLQVLCDTRILVTSRFCEQCEQRWALVPRRLLFSVFSHWIHRIENQAL